MRAASSAGDRGRLTIPYLLMFVFALAFVGALFPVFFEIFSQNASSLDEGTEYLLYLILPSLGLVLLALLFTKAIGRSP